ncbi:Protein of unknown function [Enhydrobacter aerosaccus]|uniref:DUF3995 domain-containing protein n=1 Tax=Enhydrobacter aerosaccus TaxID=225324 RepID=A0A1T4NC02_9HYPH|nr:DUF3995 domain-containing protein [Enhydrobacter aerosaccus]SJZ76810.1 Protein of unknown function [Enhydrobacter aerosaccus]
MTALLAFLLLLGVGAIAALHLLWGLGSHWPEASEEALARSVVGDGRRRMPPPWLCFAVAFVLAVVALWPVYALGLASVTVASQGSFAIAGVFIARGLAGYSRPWREHFTDEPFATRNRRYYSPLCLLLGVAYIALVSGELSK